jgi:adenosyl cobinamide kinase/adenosyl cobinamide phosphate guanylyltransferase
LSRTLFFNELFSANSLSGAISNYIISKEKEISKRREEEEMTHSTIGVVVEKSRDNLVFVTEIQTGRAFVVTDKAAKAYQSGDILALNLTTKTFVDAVGNYPFV